MAIDKRKLINELTDFVMGSSDADNLIIAFFHCRYPSKEKFSYYR